MSRFLQEILYEMLADKEALHTVTNARHIYATRQKTMHALLLRQSLDVHTGDGLNLWIPVRDEPAALRLLAEQASVCRRQAVPAEPAYQRRRHREPTRGPGRAWTRMPVEASASPSHSREPSTNKWPPPWLRRRP